MYDTQQLYFHAIVPLNLETFSIVSVNVYPYHF